MHAPLKLTALALAASSILLSGCVISLGGDGDDRGDSYQSSIEKQEARNRNAIAGLQLGTDIGTVRAQLGEPDFADAMMVGDTEVRILRYRTQRAHADGDTTRDETTPLVFKAGKLTGFGEAAAAQALSGS